MSHCRLCPRALPVLLVLAAASGAPPLPRLHAQEPDLPPQPGVPMEEPEYTAEDRRRLDAFEESRVKLADALDDLRAVQLLYRNDIDRTPASVERYRELRDLARQRLDETFEIALQIIRRVPDTAAGSYLLTLIQVRTGTDIYNESTYEAAARLMDGGVSYQFVMQSAARSGIVTGDFDTARRLYELMDEDSMDDSDLIMSHELDRIEQQTREEMQVRESEADQELPQVRLRTTQGDIVLELFLNQAPSTVSHFISLVEDGFYDELDFYQVKEGMFAMTGDPMGNGTGHAGKFVIDEQDRPDARHALRGSLTLAKNRLASGEMVPDSGSSQFAIAYLPLPGLLPGGTTFGRVVQGMDVASQMRRVDPLEKKEDEVVLPPDRILSAEVIRKPEELPEPVYAAPPQMTSDGLIPEQPDSQGPGQDGRP